ncbi:hypothetical protein JKF63_06356 [Porcisia hertigi]|uniref:Uncharacterized protein n=1 Tax=Porcisia hertigi TaxID=2761500 RepID=A0A836IX42_9TRYP|nr:hypothetical protein JKF63_06356 [Porcisia hertigi]
MPLRRPLFAGANYRSQLTLILETPGLRGVPQAPEKVDGLFEGGEEGMHIIKVIRFFNNTARWRESRALNNQVHSQVLFSTALVGSNVDILIDLGILIAKLLSFNPCKRPTAVEALRDPFFSSLYDTRDEIVRWATANPDAQREAIDDIVAYQKMHPCVVVDESPAFTWEFDHRITSGQDLRSLFKEELDKSRDAQLQIR